MRSIDWSVAFPLVGMHTLFLIGANVFLYTWFEFPLLGTKVPVSEIWFQLIFLTTILCTWTKGLATTRAVIYMVFPLDFMMTIVAQMLQTGHWTTDGTYQIAFAAAGAYFIGQMITARIFDYLRKAEWKWTFCFMAAFMIGTVYDTLAFYTIFTLDKDQLEWIPIMFEGIQIKFVWMFTFCFAIGHLTYYFMKKRCEPVEQRTKCCS